MSPPPSRRARLLRETRVTFVLALPLVLGQLSSVAMNLVDTFLAGRHGALTQAGVAIGSQIWSIVILVLIGVLMAVPPTVAQLNGAQRRDEIGAVFRQALWLALILGTGLGLLVTRAHWLLDIMRIAPEVRPGALAFLGGIAWGAPALALFFCCRYLSEGVAWTTPTMLIGVGGLLALLPIGYVLMFGRFGLPELGAAGLGYATALVLWIQAGTFLVVLARARRFRDLGLFQRVDPPRRAPIQDLLRLGLPMGVSVFMEGSLFVATGLVIGRMGAIEVAAHQIALVMASVTFMVPLGVAMATTVRVGHAVGAGDIGAVRWAAAAGFAIVAITQTLASALMIFGAALIAGLLSVDPAVRSLAVGLMALAAAFQYVDGIQALSAGALRGLKDTRVPMFITAFAYWGMGMPLGAALGLGLGWGPHGMWCGLIAGLTFAAILLTRRFLRLARQPLSQWTERALSGNQ